MPKVKKLKNGLNVITIPTIGTKAITIMALFPVGSRFENAKLAGASHFVEHMMFKGTLKRPTYLEISKELDSVGAEYNAFTGKDSTGYYVKINEEKQELAYDFISDIVFNSTFDEKEMEKEKGVIVEELRMYDDNPIMAIDSLYEQTLFGMDHPLGRDIGGTAKTVKNLTRNELFEYYKKYYTPNNMVLVLAGAIDKKNKKKFLNYFENIKVKRGKNLQNFKEFKFAKSKKNLKDRVVVKTKKIDQAHVIMGFPGINYTDKKHYALSIMLNVLGGGMSSRLFVEVREKRGLAYMVRAGAGAYQDTGEVHVQAGLDPARLKEALVVIKSELERIANEPITKKELKDAKNNLIGHMTLALEDSSAQASWYAKKFWFGKGLKTPEQIIRELKKVKLEDVQKLAKQLFDFDKMKVAVIGNLNKQQILKMLK